LIYVFNCRSNIDIASSVTAIGTAATLEYKNNRYLDLYLNRHPHLKVFSDLPTTALVCITVDRYVLVNQFQNVMDIQVGL
jgi:hypothetical protein